MAMTPTSPRYRHTMANATLRERERTSIQPTNQDFFRFGQGIAKLNVLYDSISHFWLII